MNKDPISAAQSAKGWAHSKDQENWYREELADAIQGLAEYQRVIINKLNQLQNEVNRLSRG